MIFFFTRTPTRRAVNGVGWQFKTARNSNRLTVRALSQIEDQLHRRQSAGHPEKVALMHQHPEPVRHKRQQRHAHAPSVRCARPQIGKCFRSPGVVCCFERC